MKNFEQSSNTRNFAKIATAIGLTASMLVGGGDALAVTKKTSRKNAAKKDKNLFTVSWLWHWSHSIVKKAI